MNISEAEDTDTQQQIKRASLVWGVLVVATVASLFFNSLIVSGSAVIAVTLIITAIKSQLVGDFYMEMRHAPTLWRTLITLYVFLIPAVSGALYLSHL